MNRSKDPDQASIPPLATIVEELKHQRALMQQGFAVMEKRFERIDKRLDLLEKRFEQIDRRFKDRIKRHDQHFFWRVGFIATSTGRVIAALPVGESPAGRLQNPGT